MDPAREEEADARRRSRTIYLSTEKEVKEKQSGELKIWVVVWD